LLDLSPDIRQKIDTVVASDDEALARDFLEMRGLDHHAGSAGAFSFTYFSFLWHRC
jgi:hypothetical protein